MSITIYLNVGCDWHEFLVMAVNGVRSEWQL